MANWPPPTDVVDLTGGDELPGSSSGLASGALRRVIDAGAAAERVEVVLTNPGGKPTAVVVRNFDGAHGRHVLAHAAAIIDERKFKPEGTPMMATAKRTSSVTSGATMSNDVFRLLLSTDGYDDVPINNDLVVLAREVLRGANIDASRIFVEKNESALFCQHRLHAFPPPDRTTASRRSREVAPRLAAAR